MLSSHDLASADMSLVEDLEYHINAQGMVFIDGQVYSIEQVDPELAERELKLALEQFHAMRRRPHAHRHWYNLVARLYRCTVGPANLAMLPIGSERREIVERFLWQAWEMSARAARAGRAV